MDTPGLNEGYERVDATQWQGAAQRAAPLIGSIIIVWSAFEIILREDLRYRRWATAMKARANSD